MGGVAVKASELAKTATTDKDLLPHLSDLVDLSETLLSKEGVFREHDRDICTYGCEDFIGSMGISLMGISLHRLRTR
jgi:hypothetical protein